jgi:nucleotide-binding universal stress UspA family protein
MKNILVPVDFSDASLNALNFAIEVAKKNSAAIKLLHVCSPPYADPSIDAISTSQFIQSILENANEQIDTLIATFSNNGVTMSKLVVVGSLNSFVNNESDVDLIVMGTTGASDAINKYLGSNTLSVINNTKVPLLVVPKDLSFQVKRALYATQLDFEEYAAIDQALLFCNQLSVDMDFVHIQTEEEMNIVRDDLIISKMKEKYGHDVQIHFHNNSSVVKGLNEYMDEHHYDLLMVAHRDRNFITRFIDPGTTKSIALYSHAPVLFYHINY